MLVKKRWIRAKGNKDEGERFIAWTLEFPSGTKDSNGYHINADGIVDSTCFDKEYTEKIAKALGFSEVYYEERYEEMTE